MAGVSALIDARAAFARQAWPHALELFQAADSESRLSPEDLFRAAVAGRLVSDHAVWNQYLTRAHQQSLAAGDIAAAARYAFWLGFGLTHAGEEAAANAWWARGRRMLEDSGLDCVEQGYFLVLASIDHFFSGDHETAHRGFSAAAKTGQRFDDKDLTATANHFVGRTLIRGGRVSEGMDVLDEVMLSVTSGEVSPWTAGEIYCGVLEACRETLDQRRAREWTAALSRWCAEQNDAAPVQGACMVYRAGVMQLHGDWPDALLEAERAARWPGPNSTVTAQAHVQMAELYRLQGDFDRAEESYRQASRMGYLPEPGLALLWLARHETEAAATAIRRALEVREGASAERLELLSAATDILIAAADFEGARLAAAELADGATRIGSPVARAMAWRAEGAVLLADGQAAAALMPLRSAWSAWQSVEAPYEAARVRVLIGSAHRALGEENLAEMEFDAARWAFQQLGAVADLRALQGTAAGGRTIPAGLLSPRECDVLRLIAQGRTNKEIGLALVISEHTVARHIQNMFAKLQMSSRAALAAYWVERDRSPGANG